MAHEERTQRRPTHRQMIYKREWETVALPMVLILTGLILVGGDLAGVLSLDRIQNCWPVALISIGVLELLAPAGSQRR